LVALLAVTLFLSGCATTPPPKKGAKVEKVKTTDDGTRELEGLRPALRTKEDSLVLDLLIGYRQLKLHAPVQGPDADALKKSRRAYEDLESRLRKGGVKGKSGPERVYSIENQEALTLLEVLQFASKSAQKLSVNGDWEQARARNREIVLSRPLLTLAVEDASWGLALAEALESDIPEAQKGKLKTLNESYVTDSPQDEIVKQVNVLLAEVAEEKLRKELKKLANRAWEKDRRSGRISNSAKKVALQDTAPPPQVVLPPSNSATPASPIGGSSKSNVISMSNGTTNGQSADSANKGASPANAEKSKVDSLIVAGKYVQALRALELIDVAESGDFVRERRQKAGERFCDEKRRVASETCKRARAATIDTLKVQQLKRTASELDSCLFYFPETSVGAKVKRNREMVDVELKKLGR